jgi:hypothetical protein
MFWGDGDMMAMFLSICMYIGTLSCATFSQKYGEPTEQKIRMFFFFHEIAFTSKPPLSDRSSTAARRCTRRTGSPARSGRTRSCRRTRASSSSASGRTRSTTRGASRPSSLPTAHPLSPEKVIRAGAPRGPLLTSAPGANFDPSDEVVPQGWSYPLGVKFSVLPSILPNST